MKGTSNKIVFGPATAGGVLLGVGFGVVVGEVAGLGVRTGNGVAFGSDSNPGNELVRVLGAFIDLKAIKEIKIPATNAVMSNIKYTDSLFIFVVNFNKKVI